MLMKTFKALALLLAMSTEAVASTDWKEFVYPNYNLVMDFPRHIFLPGSAVRLNGTVTFFTSDRRAALAVTSVERGANEAPSAVLQRIGSATPAKFTYVRATKKFFVASGFWRDLIFYRRCNFSDGGVRGACFEIVYPKREKLNWDSVVSRMSKSLHIEK